MSENKRADSRYRTTALPTKQPDKQSALSTLRKSATQNLGRLRDGVAFTAVTEYAHVKKNEAVTLNAQQLSQNQCASAWVPRDVAAS